MANRGGKMKIVTDFKFLELKITANSDCSHEIKRHLLLGRKTMTSLNSVLKSRDITFPTKVRIVKAMVFQVVMYGCESWTLKKVEHQRTDAFKLWCWRRFLRVPWTARRSNQSILKETNPGISLEGMMLKWSSSTLATSCEELTHWKRLWCWEGLGAGGEGDDRGWDAWMASLAQWMWVWVNSGSWWWTGRPGVLRFMGLQRVAKSQTEQLNWTELSLWKIVVRGSQKVWEELTTGRGFPGDSGRKETMQMKKRQPLTPREPIRKESRAAQHCLWSWARQTSQADKHHMLGEGKQEGQQKGRLCKKAPSCISLKI